MWKGICTGRFTLGRCLAALGAFRKNMVLALPPHPWHIRKSLEPFSRQSMKCLSAFSSDIMERELPGRFRRNSRWAKAALLSP